MAASERAAVYFEPTLHRALRLKSAETDRTISDLVNGAVREALAEDAVDLAAIEASKREPGRSFDAFVADLKRRGRLWRDPQAMGREGGRAPSRHHPPTPGTVFPPAAVEIRWDPRSRCTSPGGAGRHRLSPRSGVAAGAAPSDRAKNSAVVRLAERAGFEPAIQVVPVCRLSNLASILAPRPRVFGASGVRMRVRDQLPHAAQSAIGAQAVSWSFDC